MHIVYFNFCMAGGGAARLPGPQVPAPAGGSPRGNHGICSPGRGARQNCLRPDGGAEVFDTWQQRRDQTGADAGARDDLRQRRLCPRQPQAAEPGRAAAGSRLPSGLLLLRPRHRGLSGALLSLMTSSKLTLAIIRKIGNESFSQHYNY